jgi:predicted esterase
MIYEKQVKREIRGRAVRLQMFGVRVKMLRTMGKSVFTICFTVFLFGLTVSHVNAQGEKPPQKVSTSTGTYDVESPDDLRKFSAKDVRELVKLENARRQGSGTVPHPILIYCFEERSFQYTAGKYKDAEIKYRLHTPRSTGFGRYPLVVHLHGIGEAGSDNIGSLVHLHSVLPLMIGPEQQDFFLLVVQCPKENPGWNVRPAKDGTVNVLMAAIEHVIDNNPIDKKRITVTGISSGGSGAWLLLFQNPDMFAGAVPTSCGVPWELQRMSMLKQTPIWLIANKGDIAPDSILQAEKIINSSGGSMAFTQSDASGHNAWRPAMEEYDCFRWMLAQKRGGWFSPPPGVVVHKPHSFLFLFAMLLVPLFLIGTACFILREWIAEQLSSVFSYVRQKFVE